MSSELEPKPQRPHGLAFLVISVLLHVAAYFGFTLAAVAKAPIQIELPSEIEFGMVDTDPGQQGSPPPAAPKTEVTHPPPTPPKPTPAPKPVSDDIVVTDAGVPKDAGVPTDAAAADAGSPALAGGEGEGQGAAGAGLGFGAGGFGGGKGGPVGAIIGLHADLEQMRKSSMLLEMQAVLQLIPEWQKALHGSGLRFSDLSRIFVATPNLKRSDLVVSARVKGGRAVVQRAAQHLAEAQGKSAQLTQQGGLEVAPWYNHGPTQREVALVAPDQFVVARPRDVPRVLGVSAGLARRQAKQPEMEHAQGPAALLAMYQGEAAALSVEGVRKLVVGDTSYVPLALRISLWHLDEFHVRLRAYGYYESGERAQTALARVDELRHALADNAQVQYFGLRSAIDEAKLERKNDTLQLETILTLHQTRYLMAFVSKALKPRD